MVEALVKAFFAAKMTRPDISKALYAVAAELDGLVPALLAVDAPVEFQERVRQQLVLAAVSYLRTIANGV